MSFYIVATPIGNYEDITLRAVKILEQVDFIVCEHPREYKRLFWKLNLKEKKYIVCNKKNEKNAAENILNLLANKEDGALISDCGTPIFEDPGFVVINTVRNAGYNVLSLPGANSIITAISLSPFKIKDFYFAGFIPREKGLREQAFQKILNRKETIIIMESPYRLKNILDLIKKNWYQYRYQNRNIFVGINLTMSNEVLLWGAPSEVIDKLTKKGVSKGEFVVVIEEIK